MGESAQLDMPPEGLGDAIFEAAHVAGIGIVVTAVDANPVRNVWVSDRAAEVFGRSRAALLEHDPLDFVAPEERARITSARAERRQGERVASSLETVIVTADGRRVPISVAITYVVSRGRHLAVSFIEDLSGRRRAEEALRAVDARFRRWLEEAPDGVAISRDGVVLWANDATARVLGYESGASMVGVSFSEHLDADGLRTMRERVGRAIATGRAGVPLLYRVRRVDGVWVSAEITSCPIEYEGGPAMLAFSRDVSERVAMQAQLARNDRLSALGTLAAGVAHEINNPLTFVLLATEALERALEDASEPPPAARGREMLEEIRHGASRVASIVRDLSAFARFDDEARGPVDLRALLATAERLVAHHLRGRAQLETTFDDPPFVLGNAGRLEQVFVNLLINAAQALPEGAPGNRIELRAGRSAEGHASITVRDNGPGIRPDIAGRIFDPFFTTKAPGVGTGLGLSICHRIVTQHGGEIRVENDGGTLVRVTLPATHEEPARPGRSARDHTAVRRRLLVVDDEPALLLTLRCLLDADHDVVTAANGREALRHLLADATFDLVLCDLAMPELDGPDVYEQVRRRRPELGDRFVFMTGGAYTEKFKSFVERCGRPCLLKPFPITEVEALLRR